MLDPFICGKKLFQVLVFQSICNNVSMLQYICKPNIKNIALNFVDLYSTVISIRKLKYCVCVCIVDIFGPMFNDRFLNQSEVADTYS